jgi:hypothetical protein
MAGGKGGKGKRRPLEGKRKHPPSAPSEEFGDSEFSEEFSLGDYGSPTPMGVYQGLRGLEVLRRDAETAHRDIKVLEDDRAIMKEWCDKAMDKVIRAGWLLMKRPGVVMPDDIVADVLLHWLLR